MVVTVVVASEPIVTVTTRGGPATLTVSSTTTRLVSVAVWVHVDGWIGNPEEQKAWAAGSLDRINKSR